MKIMGKALLLASMTGILTALILFIMDSSCAQNAVLKIVRLPGGLETEETGVEKEKKAAALQQVSQDSGGTPSVETGRKQMVSQTQGDLPQTDGKNQDGQLSSIQKRSNRDSTEKDVLDKDEKASLGGGKNTENSKKATDAASADPGKRTDSAENMKKENGQKKPVFQKVQKNYFSDAVFIGDSRTIGMQQCGLLAEAVYYAKVGIGIGGILTQRFITEDGTAYNLEEALRSHSFGKVYIMIGINDMSAGDTQWFTEKYQELLELVRNTQPEALIFIQGNIPMGYHVQDMTGSLNNYNLDLRNEASRKLADNKRIFYLEVEEIYADANGNLNSYFSSDGLHVNTDYYSLWVDYLQHHGILYE